MGQIIDMGITKARVVLKGKKNKYSSTALVDTGARMSLIDESIANHVGVEPTGRKIEFMSVSGQKVQALEGIVYEFRIEEELLKYEAVAIAEIPKAVKETLMNSGLDGKVIVGLLTPERANLLPDTTTGQLKKVPSFIL